VQEHNDKSYLNTPGATEVAAKLGSEDPSLPFFAFLNAKGQFVVNSLRPVAGKPAGANIGYPGQPEEVDWFMHMLKEGAPGLTADNARLIENYLRNQKR
jgi:hypothetical protein